MFRRIRRRFRQHLTPRARATLLLVFWAASLFLPILHVDDVLESAVAAASNPDSHVSGRVDSSGAGSHLIRACDSSRPCSDPLHHHHPLSHHDATQCPICQTLLERPAEIPTFQCAPPTCVQFVAVHVVKLPSTAERLACALARGPPLRAA